MRTITSLLLLLMTATASAQQPEAEDVAMFNAGQGTRALEIAVARLHEIAAPPQVSLNVLYYATFNEVALQKNVHVRTALDSARKYMRSGVKGVEPHQAAIRVVGALVAYELEFGTRAAARAALARMRELGADDANEVIISSILLSQVMVDSKAGTVKEADVAQLEELLNEIKNPRDAGLVALTLARARLAQKKYPQAIAAALSVKAGYFMTTRILVAARAARAAGDKAAARKYYAQVLEMRKNSEPALAPWLAKLRAEARAP